MKRQLARAGLAALAVSALAIAGLSGCGSSSTSDDDTETTATVATSSGTAVSSSSSTSGSDSTQTVETPTFDFSAGIDDDGKWEGVTATDYVTLCDYSNIQIPSSELDVSEKVESRLETIASNADVDELTDEWVEENYGSTHGYSTVEELREALTQSYQEDAEKTYIQNYIVENSTFSEVPESIVTYQTNYLVYQYTYMASKYNFTLESLISMMYGYSSQDELVEAKQDDILSQAKMYLAFQAIAETEGRTISDDDLDSYFAHYQGVSDISDYVDAYGKPYLKMTALMDLTLQDIVDNATIVDDSDSTASDDSSSSSTATSEDTSSSSDTADADSTSATSEKSTSSK